MKWRTFLLAAIAGVVMISCGGSSEPAGTPAEAVAPAGGRILKLGHVLNEQHPVHKGIMKAAELVEQNSGGKLKMTVFHSGTQGTEEECVQKLTIGTLDLTKVSMAALEQFNRKSRIFSFPYLFRSDDHYWTVLDGPIGQEMLDVALDRGLKGICYFDAGFRSFYTREKPIREAQDLQGLKMRCINSATMKEMMSALGCTPTIIEWGELYTSLSAGVVDGAENNIPSLYSSKQYEACKYYTLDEHVAVPDVIMMSRRSWDKLTDEEKGWLRAAFAGAVEYQKQLWDEECEKNLAEMEQAGLEVIRPDKASFIKASESFYNQLSNPDEVTLVEKIRAVQ